MTQTRLVHRPENCRANFAGLLPLALQTLSRLKPSFKRSLT